MKSTSHAELAVLPIDKNDRSIKSKNKFKIFLTKLSRSKTGSVGFLIVLTLCIVALFAPAIAPYDPGKIDTTKMLAPPFWSDGGTMSHILGTDNLGRDILSRIIYGSRISLVVGILSVLVAGLIGVVFGVISGYYGGIVDNFIMRLVDAFLSVPTILFCIVFLTVLDPGLPTLIIVIGVTSWVLYARMIRSETLSLREREYVKAARTMGVSDIQIMKRHILPNVTSSIIVISTLSVASTIITESSLSFLGLGIQPPTVSWGIMLSEGKEYVATSWWLATFPGLAITITVLGIIFLGEWLRDLLDPRSQGTNS
ncbi:oligopeptide ABC superfamily ATP binding cassette transporter, permease protein [Sporosarcina newyorkensis 2681]|uniref:Oligopeptide ABC superfamily ATP binding cassette transporter, permease protein n=1 Tax=Sporosarcina newyorkensis 2681 TaxID=1027292 RepID=F9DSA1_9BACL|nr:ABC transporter permease [Sporosarcina newyorkensis]EGQ26238.1 oligopeptide ABC superfamily ATP binding cassette transporter, permease protein [Sporosarcina newyorkensis 2681]